MGEFWRGGIKTSWLSGEQTFGMESLRLFKIRWLIFLACLPCVALSESCLSQSVNVR